MTTLAIMKARIANEIARDDLSTEISNAISDAIAVYQKQRFRFSDSLPNALPTFQTANGRAVYTSADNANIGTTYNIDHVYVLVGNTQQELGEEDPSTLLLYNQQGVMQGLPTWYGYEGDMLILSPIPSQVWTITMELFLNVAAPASDGEANNPWMVKAEQLIRSRAKFELATHVTRNAAMAAAMSPDPPLAGSVMGATYRAWRDLKAETNKVTGRGFIRAMKF